MLEQMLVDFYGRYNTGCMHCLRLRKQLGGKPGLMLRIECVRKPEGSCSGTTRYICEEEGAVYTAWTFGDFRWWHEAVAFYIPIFLYP